MGLRLPTSSVVTALQVDRLAPVGGLHVTDIVFSKATEAALSS